MKEWVQSPAPGSHSGTPQSILVAIILHFPSSLHQFGQLSFTLIPRLFNSDSLSKLA